MGNIQRGYFDVSKLEFLSEAENVEPENIAYYGDFFFNTRNTLDLVGKGATWTGENGKYAFNSNIARFKLNDGIDTIFFNYLYNTDAVSKQIHARATGTTSVAAIYPRALETVSYFVPSKEEQIKIGELFNNIDNLITLHQRKLDRIKEYKKGILQKMFPKKGSSVPEIRFHGFTDPWKQCKLGEVTSLCKNKAKNNEYPVYSVTNSQGFIPQTIQFEDREVASQNRSNYSIVRKNQFAYNPSRINVGSIAYLKEDKEVIISPLYVVFECLNTIDKDFLNMFIKTSSFNNQREANTAGSVRDSLSYDGFSEINIMLPSVEEQIKVGQFFKTVDHLITLHQRKIDQMKEYKKGLLQQMFV